MQPSPPAVDILVVYYSRFGAVRSLAERIAEGARGVEGVRAYLLEVEHRPVDELRHGEGEHAMEMRRAALVNRLASADALVVGTPAYFGSMASPVKRLFEDLATAASPPATNQSRPWRHHLFRDKVGGAFTASATPHGGNEQALHSILTMMMHLGMIVVTPGQQEPILENEAAPYGATTITGPEGSLEPTETDREAARDLGQRVAEITTWLHLGRVRWQQMPGRREKGFSPPEQATTEG